MYNQLPSPALLVIGWGISDYPLSKRIGYMLSPTIENHIPHINIVLVHTGPALLLLIGWCVGDHPLPLHLLPVRLRLLQHVHHVVVDGGVLLLRGEEVIEKERLQHRDGSHCKTRVIDLNRKSGSTKSNDCHLLLAKISRLSEHVGQLGSIGKWRPE